ADFDLNAGGEVEAGEGATAVKEVAANCLAQGKALYQGHAIAAVAAISPEIAAEALDLIEITYEVLPHVIEVEDAMTDGAPVLHDDLFTKGVNPKPTKP